MNALALDCWTQVCRLCNYVTVASSLWAFHQRQYSLEGNSGYLQGLVRCLDSLGWLDRTTNGFAWTPAGQALLSEMDRLAQLPELLEVSRALLDGESPKWPQLKQGSGVIQEMLEACLVSALLVIPWEEAPPEGRALLEGYGWGAEQGALARLQGNVFHYPMAYLETLIQADQLLYGDFQELRRRDAQGVEAHVDRKRDIHFSGKVFAGSVAAPFWELFLPLFPGPRVVLDVGCGDGLMLAELGKRVEGVRLVGMEYNPVARQVAQQRIQSFPGALTLEGDIGDPQRLMADLERHGIDWRETLFVTKSVIHNRPYRAPRQARAGATTSAVASDLAGQRISAGGLEGSLVEFFRSWKPYLSHHGFLVVEAHTVPPAVARRHLGRTLAPCLELTHCYSNQLLVEAEVYRDCAREAGLRSQAHRELGAAAFGHDHMTLDHWTHAAEASF